MNKQLGKEHKVKQMFRQIMQAVKLMHGKLICHRDLKLDNILVTDNGKPKIIDFGFAI